MINTTLLNNESEAYTMKRQFTLVELLVVIGIIAILAGLLLPVLNKSRDKAIQTECAGNLGQLAKAEFAYSADNGQKFLGGVEKDIPKSWVVALYDYVKEIRTFRCGADEFDDMKEDYGAANGGEYVVSYLNNAGLTANKKRYLCEQPTRTMLYGPRKHVTKIVTAWPLGYTAVAAMDTYKFFDFTDADGNERIRHDQVTNFVFLDGHTEVLTFEAFKAGNTDADLTKRYWATAP